MGNHASPLLSKVKRRTVGTIVKNIVGGERKTANKKERLIAASPERSSGIGIEYSKETDKGPLTAASSCFRGLCHHMTPP